MYFTSNDINIYYEKYGNKDKNIIIIPGWGDTRKTFNYIINMLKNYFTVYIIDLPGFGNSSFPNKDLNVYDYSNLIKDFIELNNINNPIMIGHSFGGRVIITLCGYYQYIKNKIILINSAGIKPKKNIFKLLKQTIYKILKHLKKIIPKKYKNKYLNYLINIFGSNDFKNLSSYMRKTFINIINEDLVYYLKDIENETLILWGDKDKDTPVKDAKKMNKSIKNSALIMLKGGHFSYLENIQLVNNILYEYLKEDI